MSHKYLSLVNKENKKFERDIKRDAERHPLNSTGLKEAHNTTPLNNNIFKKFVKRFLNNFLNKIY